MVTPIPNDNIIQITELAKQGGRLSSDKQWELADALAQLTDTEITQVAIHSKRNESTLHQYARAAERWPTTDRVEGVSFSAHRVVLSWHDPRGLLVELKHKHGSPTVRQVRQAMGLEGHPAIEQLEKGINKLDRKVSEKALNDVIARLLTHVQELRDGGQPEYEYDEKETTYQEQTEGDVDKYQGLGRCRSCGTATSEQYTDGSYLCDDCDESVVTAKEATVEQHKVEDNTSKRWTPPINTSDIAGI